MIDLIWQSMQNGKPQTKKKRNHSTVTLRCLTRVSRYGRSKVYICNIARRAVSIGPSARICMRSHDTIYRTKEVTEFRGQLAIFAHLYEFAADRWCALADVMQILVALFLVVVVGCAAAIYVVAARINNGCIVHVCRYKPLVAHHQIIVEWHEHFL